MTAGRLVTASRRNRSHFWTAQELVSEDWFPLSSPSTSAWCLRVKIRSPANGFKFSARSSQVSRPSGGKAATSAWWLNESTCRRKNGIRSETVL
jgi:hypothetical protein